MSPGGNTGFSKDIRLHSLFWPGLGVDIPASRLSIQMNEWLVLVASLRQHAVGPPAAAHAVEQPKEKQ